MYSMVITEIIDYKGNYIGIQLIECKLHAFYIIHLWIYLNTHTHTHTHIYIYIYIERESLKNKGWTPEIQWSILKKSNTPKCFDSRCNLCLEEKIQIMIYPNPEKLSNQGGELIARSRHRNKFKL